MPKTPSQLMLERVRDRLVSDVGGLINLVTEKQIAGERQNPPQRYEPPYWAFLRMMMPIAEAIGDLLHGDKSSMNLYLFFSSDLSKYNADYKKVAATLTLLYRHSITHQDELRSLTSRGGIEVQWAVGFNCALKHLAVIKELSGKRVIVQFDINTFYADLCNLLNNKLDENLPPEIYTRYQGWLKYNLANKQMDILAEGEIASL